MIAPDGLRRILLEHLASQIGTIVSASGLARHFASSTSAIPADVLQRHWVEHVFRIRMFRALDSAAARALQRTASPDIYSVWSAYGRSEAVHDRYFLRDLDDMGLDRSAVQKERPFAATRRLGAYVGEAMRSYGALPVVLYSFWTEENSEVGSVHVIRRAQNVFGARSVRGATAHRALDRNQQHTEAVSRVLASLIRDADTLEAAIGILDGLGELLGEYFRELEVWPHSQAGVDSRSRLTAHPPAMTVSA